MRGPNAVISYITANQLEGILFRGREGGYALRSRFASGHRCTLCALREHILPATVTCLNAVETLSGAIVALMSFLIAVDEASAHWPHQS